MADSLRTNLLYFSDNLVMLRDEKRFPDESVDLVYLDPPFNSKRDYNVIFKENDVRPSEAQIHAFEDTWAWDSEGRVDGVLADFWISGQGKPADLLNALITALGRNDVTAYLTMMAPRLLELHRILKPTGSLYLHCDPSASHYLKLILDSIFGPQHFRNEIIWKRTHAHGSAKRFGPVHDVILFYSKGRTYTWTNPRGDHAPDYVSKHFRLADPNGRKFQPITLTGSGVRHGASGLPWRDVNPTAVGRHWALPGALLAELGIGPGTPQERLDALDAAGLIYWPEKEDGTPRLKQYADSLEGQALPDVWVDIPPVSANAKERLHYPTQKPEALLERILEASTRPGEVVLDPFCGCGTAVHSAHKLGRRWIGIDITPLATDLVRRRMEDAFPGLKVEIDGWPSDMAGARALANLPDRYPFQGWAVAEIGAQPVGGKMKKGADKGIDGVIPFKDGIGGKNLRGIVSVKSGQTKPADVQALAGVVEADDNAAFGIFVCLEKPTKAMIEAALKAGRWTSNLDGQSYRKIQILSAEDILAHKMPEMPAGSRLRVYAEAERENPVVPQGRLLE